MYFRFVSPGGPWFGRGADCHRGTVAGVFAFGGAFGDADAAGSFRVVLFTMIRTFFR